MTHTIQSILDETYKTLDKAKLFFGHGTDNAWDEAVFLVLSACQLPLDSGDSVLTQPVTSAQKQQIKDWILQRTKQHIPLPYITHEAWFCGLPFYVDQRVLIPRSPFAEWIQSQFEPWCQPSQLKNILEIGTGSGCIAIATALHLPEAQVDASDISVDALAVAARNIQRHGVQDRVHLLHSDVFASLPIKHYDLIISNPPYVSAEEMRELPAEYRQEPQFALEADNEGMAIVDRILQRAVEFLSPQGVLMVEVGYSQDIFSAHYPELPVIWLEQEQGGEGIFCIDYQTLKNSFEG